MKRPPAKNDAQYEPSAGQDKPIGKSDQSPGPNTLASMKMCVIQEI